MTINSKKFEFHKNSYPAPFYRKKSDNNIEKLLDVIAQADTEMSQQIINGRAQKFLMSSEGKYLSVHGNNVKVSRPKGWRTSEETYREIVRLIGYYPHQTIPIFERLIKLFWGERALVDDIVQLYNIEPSKIEIIIDALAPIIAAQYNLINATYLHETSDLAVNDFYSGYLFDIAKYSTVLENVNAGVTVMRLAINLDDFPTSQFTIAIGNKDSSTYEVKYVISRTGDTLILSSPLSYYHASGEYACIPIYPAEQKTNLTNAISAGSSASYLYVNDSAQFPDANRAIWIDYDKENREIVPYTSRIYNNRLEIDSSYIFEYNHDVDASVKLCCQTPFVNKSGKDYHFKLTSNDIVREYFIELLNRVKREGVRLSVVFE